MIKPLLTQSFHLRSKHALFVRCDLTDYLIDYYLNQRQVHTKPSSVHDEELKKLLAALALHITMRAPDESIAWTLLMHDETPYSLFVTGSAAEQTLVGQVLYSHIRHSDINMFHSQVSRRGSVSKSAVKCESSNIVEMVETFYSQSEQLSLKLSLFEQGDQALALIGMPGVDEQWFAQITPLEISQELPALEHKLMKECAFSFSCNCSPEKLLPFFRSIDPTRLDELYGEDEALKVHCPRCGKMFEVHRDSVE